MEKRFDPMTGQPIQQMYDPMTGQPVQPQYDPMTGQPIQPQAAPVQQPQYDPMTGQPVQPQYDPMTGQPVQQMYTAQQQMQFDSVTGQPVHQIYSVPQQSAPKKKSKIGFIIGGIVAILAIIAAAVVVVAKTGLFLSPNEQVLVAFTNTWQDKTYLTEALDITHMVDSGKYTLGLSGTYEDNSLDLNYLVTPKSQQITGNVSASGIPNVDFNLVIANGKVQGYTSLVDKYLFEYNYNKENTGYLMQQATSEDIEMINKALKEMENAADMDNSQAAELSAKWLSDYHQNIKFEKTDAKKYEIDGKEVSCKGYKALVTKDNLRVFVDDLKAEVSNVNNEITADFDEIYDTLNEMPDMNVSVYIYKNKLASISLQPAGNESTMELVFHGGNARWQNMELLVDRSSIMKVVGTVSGDSESYDIQTMGTSVASIDYNKSTGVYNITVDGESLSGTLTNNGKEMTFSIDYIEGLSGSISVKKGADIQVPSAENTFDLGNASEEEFQSLVMEIVGSGSALGDLLYESY